MRKPIFRVFSLLIMAIIMVSSIFAVDSQAATNDFSMKAYDKAYITFIFDDGDSRIPFTKECFEMFERIGMPMGCAVVANNLKKDESKVSLFKEIQKAGGEIYSHTYSHTALHKDNSTIENIERELGDSYRVLTGLGFNVQGVIEAGNGGGEKSANYELIETVSRKYYKYSNAYGVSAQYKMIDRATLSSITLAGAKSLVDDAVKNKKWIILWAHSFDEFSKDNMTKLLEHINAQGKNNVEVVNTSYIYEKFGKYTGPQVPTTEAIESVCSTQGHDIKNGTVVTAATCDKGPVLKGVCERCGKTGTSQSTRGALGHKFENYVSDNNGNCIKSATKTAKCSNKGCTATDTVDDTKFKGEHDLKTVVIKEATKDATGLAELKCSVCGYVKKEVMIPKGKKADDVIEEPTTSENNTDATNSIDLSEFSSSSKIPVWVIIVSIAVSVLAIAAIVVAVIFIIKKLKA